jgi:hypothetical protein
MSHTKRERMPEGRTAVSSGAISVMLASLG